MAAVACALELYRRKAGIHPVTLEELVPDYLPKLPVDAATGRSFIYRSANDGTYVLYSVGFDGIDQGGTLRGDGRSLQDEEDWPFWPFPGPLPACGAPP